MDRITYEQVKAKLQPDPLLAEKVLKGFLSEVFSTNYNPTNIPDIPPNQKDVNFEDSLKRFLSVVIKNTDIYSEIEIPEIIADISFEQREDFLKSLSNNPTNTDNFDKRLSHASRIIDLLTVLDLDC